MPNRDGSQFLGAAIESVLAQTDSDWELIVLDDHSQDASAEVAGRYAESDSRISLVELPSPRGASAARNAAIRRARGRYLAFLDSDDLWTPEKLEAAVLASDAAILLY